MNNYISHQKYEPVNRDTQSVLNNTPENPVRVETTHERSPRLQYNHVPDQSQQSTDTSNFNKHDKYIPNANTSNTNLTDPNTSNHQIPAWFLNLIKNVGI